MSKKTIVIIANLDTRGEEFKFVKELIERRGHRGIVLDFSMETVPFYPGDITCEEVARRGGPLSIEEVREYYKKERKKATDTMIGGAVSIVMEMLGKGEVHGVLGVGGGTASLVATSVMRKLPFGLPKLMASSMAAHPAYVSDYVGTRDITMHHTVVDVVEMNPLLRAQIVNAIGAICGMVEMNEGQQLKSDKPMIAISSFGFAERCVQPAIGLLRERGFEPIPCHAQGKGDRAMDELIRDGVFAGALDVVTRGIGEELFRGNCAAGNDRVLAASEMGVPQVVSTSGLDMISYGNRKDSAERYRGRKLAVIDELRLEVRTTPEELAQIALVMAERLNRAKAPTSVLVPLRGWSSLSVQGRQLYDPEADAVFVAELKRLVKPEIAIKEVDLALNTPEFARVAVDEFDALYKLCKR